MIDVTKNSVQKFLREGREIKFRAWNYNENIMYSFDICRVNGYHPNGSNNPLVEVNGWGRECLYWLQYVGESDTNGKEIYEGDIVVYDPHLSSYDKGQIGVVVWSKQKCGYVLNNKNSYKNHSLSRLNKKKVVGNMFENYNLLG